MPRLPMATFYEWQTGSGNTLTLNKLAPRNPVALAGSIQ
jgi:hypothetical protein